MRAVGLRPKRNRLPEGLQVALWTAAEPNTNQTVFKPRLKSPQIATKEKDGSLSVSQ